MRLKDKVIVIAGGARDIGQATSLRLAAEGAKLAINYLSSADEAKQTLEKINNSGGSAILVQGDMTSKQDVDHLMAKTTEAYGENIDVLVNVVGGLVARKTIEEMDEDFFNLVIKLNLNSTFLLTKAVTPFMSSGSSIVNLASQAGRDGGGPGATAYATSKGAVVTFTRAMAKELGPKNIRVNALCPGMISTTFHDTFTKQEVRSNVANSTPLRREGKADEIANAVLFLASDEASFITGANIDINGGLLFS